MLNFLKPPSRGHLAFLGILAAALGVAAIIWPNVTVGVAVSLFAIYAFVNAIGQVVAMFTVERSVGRDILRLVMALIDVAAGIVALAYPGITAEVLAIVVGIWAIFGGSVELAGAWTRPQRMAGPGRAAHGCGWNRIDRLAEHRGGLAGAGFRDLPTRLRDHVAAVCGDRKDAPEPRREAGPQLGSPLIRTQLSTIVGAARGSKP
jgi:hypothetical protein